MRFNNEADLDTALSKSGGEIVGRKVDIAKSKGKKNTRVVSDKNVPEGCTTIFVGNLPYDITEDNLGDRFRGFGAIKNV